MSRSALVYAAITVFLLTACGQTPEKSPDPASKVFPENRDLQSNLPVIDGSIGEEDWQAAEALEFQDGSQLYLLLADENLYLAIRSLGDGLIAGNVFLQQGDRILVLHTSAALGTAVYVESGGSWQRQQDFEWCCRSRIASETTLAEREDFFDREGWLGANSFLGEKNELEYRIRAANGPFVIAVNFLQADDPDYKQVWPIGLSDGVALPAAGGFPEEMDFSPQDWFVLEAPQ